MTEEQKKILSILLKSGQIKRLPYEDFKVLTEENAQILIEKAMQTAPGTFTECPAELRAEMRSYLSQGYLPQGITSADIQHMNLFIATFLKNEFALVTGDGLKKIDRMENDTKPATDKQLTRIKKLILEKYLDPITTEALATMNNMTAKKLIFKGLRTKMLQENGTKNE